MTDLETALLIYAIIGVFFAASFNKFWRKGEDEEFSSLENLPYFAKVIAYVGVLMMAFFLWPLCLIIMGKQVFKGSGEEA